MRRLTTKYSTKRAGINGITSEAKADLKASGEDLLVGRRVTTSVDERRSCDIVGIVERHNE